MRESRMATKTSALRDWIEDEGTPIARRALILEGGASLCAYVGIPADHPLAGRNYDDMPLECHGGLTFGDAGSKRGPWPAGWYWYGWDYAHLGDITRYDRKYRTIDPDAHEWTVEEVEAEARQVMEQLKRLLLEEMVD
jgi:hypothetical protein